MYIYEKIRNDLIEIIDRMNPHTRIPSRKELCQKFMVTRTTIDRAITELIEAGYLYAVVGSGTYVSDLASKNIDLSKGDFNIGVLLPDITADTYPSILRGIQDAAEILGLNVVVCNTDNRSEKQISCIKRLINSKVHGMIIVPAIDWAADISLNEVLAKTDVPYVFCNRNVTGSRAPCICSNDFYGGFLATSHLLDRGYRRIVYLSAVFYKTSLDRYQGYLAALCNRGIHPDEKLILINEYEPDRQDFSVHSMLEKLLKEDRSIDAVVCFNDRVACDAMATILSCGLKISHNVGVIGYDNTHVCQLLPVKLTSMDYRDYEIGRYSLNTLYKRITFPTVPIRTITTFSPQVVDRDSCCGPVRD